MKKYIKLILISLFLITLTGCGSKNIGEKVQKIMDEAKSVEINEIFECNISNYDKQSNTKQEIKVVQNLNTTMIQNEENNIMYKSNGDIIINIFGKEYKNKILEYNELTEDQNVIYFFDYDDNTWGKQIDKTTNSLNNKYEINYNDLLNLLKISKKSIYIDNKKCYEYHGVLMYDELNSIMTYADDISLELSNDKYMITDDVNVKVWFYIDKKTYKPVKLIFEICNKENPINLKTYDNKNIETKVDIYKITFNYNSFDKVDSFFIPNEMYNAKEYEGD